MRGLASEFKNFLARGNVVDLAVAVVLGTAFGVVIKALVADLLTPIIALIFGQPDFGALSFTINSSHFYYGDFINSLITFVSVAAAIFFFVVKPLNSMAARRAAGRPDPDADTRACTECLSEIPKAARRCAFCTAEQSPLGEAGDQPAASVA
ncbi:MAG: large conductance mechanosensitive channel protein MscL [Solirubrobacteraceae bacterium]|jgi:large conductance mechanosensitive channel